MKKKKNLGNKIFSGLVALVIGCSPIQQQSKPRLEARESIKQQDYLLGSDSAYTGVVPPLISLETLADEHPIYYSRQDSVRVLSDSLRARFEIYVDLVRTKENKIEVNDVRFGEILFAYYRDEELLESSISRDTKEYTKKQREFFERYEPIISRIKHSFRYTTYSDGTMYERVYTIPVGQNSRTKEYKGKKRVGIDYRNFKNEK